MIERDELLEHALVYGDYKGIPKQQVFILKFNHHSVLSCLLTKIWHCV